MLSNTEISFIKKLYPGLSLAQREGKCLIAGELYFCACYDKASDILTIKPDLTTIRDANFIEDKFKVEIELLANFPRSFPLVHEVGGRVGQILQKYDIKNISDLHINKEQNNAVCLCPKPAEQLRYPDRVDIVHFINNLVIPFFYGLSYYDKNREWPWDEYSHGDLGIFEFYAENANKRNMALAKNCYEALKNRGKELILKKHIKGHLLCDCGSGKKFRDCHDLALHGIWALKTMLNNQ